jgi:septal ring factor EnvC (AmiA/AmiB activator)
MILSVVMFVKKIWDNKILLALGGLGLVSLSFYIYYTITSAQIKSLERDKIELQKKVKDQELVISLLKEDYQKIIKINNDLSVQIDNNKKETDALRKQLHRENEKKKSLEELATKKTSLIEKIINKGTQNVLTCFEVISSGGDC